MTDPASDDTVHHIEDELAMANFIVMRRVYDVLARILANINPEDADILMKMHEDGAFATPELRIKLIKDG